MRRAVSAVVLAFLLSYCSVPALASGTTLAVFINGHLMLSADSPPFVLNHRLMLPLRATAEGLGYRVEFRDADQAITLFNSVITTPVATLWLFSDRVAWSGAEFEAPFPVITRSGRSFIPAEFAADLLGFDVRWDKDRSALSITTNAPTVLHNLSGLVAAAESFCGANPDLDEESGRLAKQQIWIDSDGPALTAAEELMVLRAPAQTSPGRLNQACSVTVRRAQYQFPPHSDRPVETGWLVTYDGLELYGHGPSTVVNRELKVVLAQDFSPLEGLTYR